jgi:hypothetical protein
LISKYVPYFIYTFFKETPKGGKMETEVTIKEAYMLIFKDYPEVIGVKEVSQMLGICSKKVYQLIKNKIIPIISYCKVYRIAKICVIEYLLKLRKQEGGIEKSAKA